MVVDITNNAIVETKHNTETGRRFRHFIWRGVRLTVNGALVEAIDSLYLHPSAKVRGAEAFGDLLEYEVSVDPNDPAKGTGRVEVRVSALPVHESQGVPNRHKRAL